MFSSGDSVLSFVVKTFEGVSIDGNLSLIFKSTGEWDALIVETCLR